MRKYVGRDRDYHDDQNRDRVYNCRDIVVQCMDPGQGERCLLKIQFSKTIIKEKNLHGGSGGGFMVLEGVEFKPKLGLFNDSRIVLKSSFEMD